MRPFHLYSLLILCFFLSTKADGQIVNVESARMQSDTVGWMGGAGVSMNLTQNTQKIFGAELETHLQYKTSNDKGLWLILGDYNFLRVGEDRFISNGYAHLRYNRKINDWIRWEVFGQFQNNIITQIDSRLLFGTGPRFKVVKNKYFRLYAASLVMYENEKERTNPAVVHNDIRSSSYVSFTYTPSSNIELISTTFFQPLLRKFSDYRVLNQVKLRVKATKHFSLSTKWNYLYDKFPAGNAPNTNYNFSTGIDYDL